MIKNISTALTIVFLSTFSQAQDLDLENSRVEMSCVQATIQIDDEAVNTFWHENNPERYRLELTQIDENPMFERYDRITNSYFGGLRSPGHRMLVEVYNRDGQSSEAPLFSTEVDVRVLDILGQMQLEGGNGAHSFEGAIGLEQGFQDRTFVIDGKRIFFECSEGIELHSRGRSPSSQGSGVLNEEVLSEESIVVN